MPRLRHGVSEHRKPFLISHINVKLDGIGSHKSPPRACHSHRMCRIPCGPVVFNQPMTRFLDCSQRLQMVGLPASTCSFFVGCLVARANMQSLQPFEWSQRVTSSFCGAARFILLGLSIQSSVSRVLDECAEIGHVVLRDDVVVPSKADIGVDNLGQLSSYAMTY